MPSEHKGKLPGIVDRLPELVEAGVTAVVLNMVSEWIALVHTVVQTVTNGIESFSLRQSHDRSNASSLSLVRCAHVAPTSWTGGGSPLLSSPQTPACHGIPPKPDQNSRRWIYLLLCLECHSTTDSNQQAMSVYCTPYASSQLTRPGDSSPSSCRH